MKEIKEKEKLNEFISNENLSIIKIGASWCGPCRMIEPILERISVNFFDNISIIDADESSDMISDLGVRNVPTVIFYKNGTEVDRKVGSFTEEEFKELIIKNK